MQAVEWQSLAKQQIDLGDYEAALESFERALSLNPQLFDAWEGKVKALNQLQRYEEAEATLEQAIALCGEALKLGVDYWLNQGIQQFNAGKWKDAIASFDKALQYKPDDSFSWRHRGFALNSLGRFEEAIASYDQALQYKPDDAQTWSYRSVALVNLGRNEEAIASYKQATELNEQLAVEAFASYKQATELDEQLAVEAFLTALETCREEGIELPEAVWAIAQFPEHHVAELSEIAKQHPQLNAAYQTARKLLRQAEGDRNKRMNISGGQAQSEQIPPLSERLIHPPEFPREKEVKTSSASSHRSSDHCPEAADPATRSESAAASPTAPIQPIVYRYTLPDTASPQAAIAFSKQVEAIRQSNPDWVVSFDRPNPGEADAIVLIHKDEHYATTHAAYLMNRTLNQVVGSALTRIFGATSS